MQVKVEQPPAPANQASAFEDSCTCFLPSYERNVCFTFNFFLGHTTRDFNK